VSANTLVNYKKNRPGAMARSDDVAQNRIAGLENPASKVNGVMEFRSNRLVNGFHKIR
jgi:hypothetical protein